MYKRSITNGQALLFKRICSIEEKISNHPEQLRQWLVERGYRENYVDLEIEKIKPIERTISKKIRDKNVDDNIQH